MTGRRERERTIVIERPRRRARRTGITRQDRQSAVATAEAIFFCLLLLAACVGMFLLLYRP